MVLDSGYVLESPGELLQDSKSQTSILEHLGVALVLMFLKETLSDSKLHLWLRPTGRSKIFLGRSMNVAAEVGSQENSLGG